MKNEIFTLIVKFYYLKYKLVFIHSHKYTFKDFNSKNGFFDQIIQYINNLHKQYKFLEYYIANNIRNKKRIYKIITTTVSTLIKKYKFLI